MNALQLEFNIDLETETEIRLKYLEKRLDEIYQSLNKVDRRLFHELNDLRKKNDELKTLVRNLNHEKTYWSYGQKNCLFDASKTA